MRLPKFLVSISNFVGGMFLKYISGIPRTFVTMTVKFRCFRSQKALHVKRAVFSWLYLSFHWRNFSKIHIWHCTHIL